MRYSWCLSRDFHTSATPKQRHRNTEGFFLALSDDRSGAKAIISLARDRCYECFMRTTDIERVQCAITVVVHTKYLITTTAANTSITIISSSCETLRSLHRVKPTRKNLFRVKNCRNHRIPLKSLWIVFEQLLNAYRKWAKRYPKLSRWRLVNVTALKIGV